MSDAKPKKNFFKKPAWLVEKEKNQVKSEVKPTQEKEDATSLFKRSTGTVSEVLAEQKRKEQLRAEKKAQKDRLKEEDAPRKRRKTSEEGEYDGDREGKKDSISPRRTSASRSAKPSSPKSLTKRYEAQILAKMQQERNAIELSDDDDPSTSYKPSKPKSSPTKRKQPVQQQEDEVEEVEAFPELAAQARERARQQEEERKLLSRSATRENGSSTPVDTGPNPTLSILVWSPLDGTEPLLVKRKWNQNFRDIRKAWLGRQPGLNDKQKSEIYFTWRNKKIFDVATCKSLGIKLDQYGNSQIPNDQGPYRDENGDKICLCATTDEQIKLEKEQEEAEKKRKEKETEEPETPSVSESSGQIRIILRAKGYPEQRLMVKPDTEINRLQGAFRNQNKIPDSKSVTLMIDGDPLEPDSTIADAEVEDMDMIEILVK